VLVARLVGGRCVGSVRPDGPSPDHGEYGGELDGEAEAAAQPIAGRCGGRSSASIAVHSGLSQNFRAIRSIGTSIVVVVADAAHRLGRSASVPSGHKLVEDAKRQRGAAQDQVMEGADVEPRA
jgi:hypothetical protein